jgi:hypothetical protein
LLSLYITKVESILVSPFAYFRVWYCRGNINEIITTKVSIF